MYLNQMDPVELLEKVDAFYNSAWDKLIFVAGVFVGLIGIVVPFIVQYFQSRSLKLQEREIMIDVERQLSGLKQSLVEEIRNEYRAEVENLRGAFHIEVKKLNVAIDRSIDISRARTLHLEAQAWLKSNDYLNASGSFFRCLRLYMKCEEYESASKVIRGLNKLILPNLTKDNISKVFSDQDRNQESYINELLKYSPDYLEKKIKKLNKIINELP